MWTFWIHLVRKSQNAQQDVWLLHHFCVLLTTCACSCLTKIGWKKIWPKIPSVTWLLSKSSALIKVTFNLGPLCLHLSHWFHDPILGRIPTQWQSTSPFNKFLQIHIFNYGSSGNCMRFLHVKYWLIHTDSYRGLRLKKISEYNNFGNHNYTYLYTLE